MMHFSPQMFLLLQLSLVSISISVNQREVQQTNAAPQKGFICTPTLQKSLLCCGLLDRQAAGRSEPLQLQQGLDVEAPQRLHLLHNWKERSRQKAPKTPMRLNCAACWPLAALLPAASGFPTFVVVHLVPVAVDHVRFQKVQEGARDEEAVDRGEVLDVARVQREGVGWRGDGAQAHQLADDVPHTNT